MKVLSKNSCTCLLKHEWYHIIAAKLYLGTDEGKRQKRMTMAQLERCTRSKCGKQREEGQLAENEVEAVLNA